MSTRTFPTWDQRDTYLTEAVVGLDRVQADVADDSTNVWQSIDVTIAALHRLREASGSEQSRRHAEMVVRMEAEAAARADRPAEPTAEVVAELRQLVELGQPVLARLKLRDETSMSHTAIAAFVEDLAGTREGVQS